MRQKVLAVLIAVAMANAQDSAPRVEMPQQEHWYDKLLVPYQPRFVPPVSFENSRRIESLLRAGKLYLSLQDAIALALENNLDIELERFAPGIAEFDSMRTRGGAAPRGLSYSILELPQGIGGPASPLLNLPASGSTPTTSVPTTLTEVSAIVPAQTSSAITNLPFATGPSIPGFDPAVIGALNLQHLTTPETNQFIVGANALTSQNVTGNIGLQKGFSLGTQFSATFNANHFNQNSNRNTINPYANSNLGLSLDQPLLRGFGTRVNRRYIHIAKNDERISDLLFRQQVIATVAGVIRLYIDLVSLVEDVQVKQQTLALAERLYQDNKEKVDQGTLAPIELVRAQAQMAASRQDLANSQGFELQQELLMKTVLTKRGTSDPLIREARIVTTTPIDVPATEDVRPIQDMLADAFGNRPELEEARLQIANSELSMKGSKNALLPQVDILASAQNSGLAGSLNPFSSTSGSNLASTPNETFVGGFGSALGQIFRRNYPTYAVGLQFNLPIHNRIAEGDYVRDQMQFRQTQIRQVQLENQIRLEAEGALIALQRARAAYDAAVEARKLQEQSLQIEMEKYANGISTTFLVQQYQSYVAQARSTEVSSRGTYAKAKTQLERAIGLTLQGHNVSIDEVMHGRISTPPAALPALPVGAGSRRIAGARHSGED
jgi:outer membrane protein